MPVRAQNEGGNRASSYSHLDFKMGWTVSTVSLLNPKKDMVGIEQEARWASKPVWTDKSYLTPTGILPQDLLQYIYISFKITVQNLFVYNKTDEVLSNSKDSGLCLAAARFELWQVVVNVAVREISSASTSALPSVIIPLIQNSHVRSSATAQHSLISENVLKQTVNNHFFTFCPQLLFHCTLLCTNLHIGLPRYFEFRRISVNLKTVNEVTLKQQDFIQICSMLFCTANSKLCCLDVLPNHCCCCYTLFLIIIVVTLYS